MLKNRRLFGSIYVVMTAVLPLFGQSVDFEKEARVVVSGTAASTDSLIAIAPSTSWATSVALQAAKPAKPSGDLPGWIGHESAVNGLHVPVAQPWHIVIGYEQFDEDGDKVHSGTFDEMWVAPTRYRTTYKGDDLNQTDFATGTELFRSGEQRWPNRAELEVPAEIIEPFAYAATLQGFRMRSEEQSFGPHMLHCVNLEHGPGAVSSPTEYCFGSSGSALRYVRGWGWHQTVYNDLTMFEGRVVAREVEVTDGGKPYLKLRVTKLESVPSVDDAELTPPADAVKLSGKRVTGVPVVTVQQTFPEWPDSMRHDHFSVQVEIVVGTDGHVVSAQAISGPPNAYKAAESTARKWVFRPFLILGQPTEVSTKIILNND
jgi:hypothetical protein